MKAHNRAARKPAFFMLGAPKCGTTALASYLATHPLIRVSEPEEPNYFCKDLQVDSRLASDEECLATFFRIRRIEDVLSLATELTRRVSAMFHPILR